MNQNVSQNFKSALAFTLLSGLFATAQAATITDVSIRQRWPWSQKADIAYSLVADKAQEAVSIALYAGQTKLDIPAAALSGDLWNVQPGGPHTIVFDPSKSCYTNQILTNFRAVLTPTEPPLYIILDLAKDATDSNAVTYLSAYDITNGVSEHNGWEWGSFYHTGTNIDSRWQNTIVWTGVTNDNVYKSSKIVMRYIPAGTFWMGSPDGELGQNQAYHPKDTPRHSVTLTKPFYASVFLVTAAQYKQATGITPGYSSLQGPAFSVSINDLRGDSTNYPWYSSPEVSPTNFMGLMRARLPSIAFDLPTEPQWEYACRAGTTGSWNNGFTITNITTDLELDSLAIYGHTFAAITARIVGMKLPNGWGLYDMHGLTWKLCLSSADYVYTSTSETDPIHGKASGSDASMRGGYFNNPTISCRSANRNYCASSTRMGTAGFYLFGNFR